MKNPLSQRAYQLLPVLLAAFYVVIDLIIDHTLYDVHVSVPHIIAALAVLLATGLAVAHVTGSRQREAAVARQVQAELAARVLERTTELQEANRRLVAEIAERRRTEDALRANEAKYRLLFQNMAEGFAVYELLYDETGRAVDWKVVEINPAYTHHTGFRPDQVLGCRGLEKFGPSAAQYLPYFEKVVREQTPLRFETRNPTVGRYQRVSTFPAGGNSFASVIEDISERKQAEESLCASEEKFARVFQLSPDAICLIDAQSDVILDANEAFGKAMGPSAAHAVGLPWQKLGIISEEDRARLERIYADERQVLDLEVELAPHPGRAETLLVSLIPVTVSDRPCILVIGHDITARKKSQEALRRAEAELAIGLQARAALEERHRLARELHDSVSQALYGVSLGVNAALTLYDEDREQSLHALRYALSLSRTALTEMRALIFELRPESLESDGLIIALRKQADALRARYRIDIRVSLCEEPAIPPAVKEALYRIAQEALNNAMKHAHAQQIEIRLAADAGNLILEVCDDGRGFDPEVDYSGHLGLKSMRERAQAVGGSLEITSALACGALVRATVPVSPAAAAAP